MRFFVFLFGIVVGVAGAVAYMVFATLPAAVAQAPALPAHPPLAVTFGESFVTSLLQRTAIQAPGVTIPAGALRAELRDDEVVLHADLDIVGQASRGSAVLRPVVRDGKVAFDVVKTSLGALPMPALRQIVDEHVNAQLQRVFTLLPVEITGIEVRRATGMTVSCRVDLERLTRPLVP